MKCMLLRFLEKYWFIKARYRVLEGKRGIRKAYDEIAELYDVSRYLYWTREMEKCEEKFVGRWLEVIDDICLDIGCGTGRYTVRIAERNREVVALDISIKMLRKMLEKAEKRGVREKIYPIIADGEKLPFRENSFRSIVCTLTFNHFTNSDRAVKEFSRVLKNNSLCIISTFNSYMLNIFQKRFGFKDKIPFRTEKMSPVLIYEKGYSGYEIEEMFSKHGFRLKCIKGICYPLRLDIFFNKFKALLKYAVIHVVLMEKST